MIIHPSISVLFLVQEGDASLAPLLHYLQSIPSIQLTTKAQMPEEIHLYDVIVTVNTGEADNDHDRLEHFVQTGGRVAGNGASVR